MGRGVLHGRLKSIANRLASSGNDRPETIGKYGLGFFGLWNARRQFADRFMLSLRLVQAGSWVKSFNVCRGGTTTSELFFQGVLPGVVLSGVMTAVLPFVVAKSP
jgi:hypothetical protein